MKFLKTNKTDFYSGLNMEINSYFKNNGIDKYADAKFWIKGTGLIAFYLIAYYSIFKFNGNFFVQLAGYVSLGLTGVLIVFNIVHDASHHAVSKNRKVNQYLSLLGDLVGINTYIWDIRHNVQHHSFTNIPDADIIIDSVPLIRLTKHQKHKWFHKFQVYYAPLLYMFYSFYWMAVIDFNLFFKKNICNLKNIKHPSKEWIKLIAFKLFYVIYTLILPLAFTSLTLGEVLTCFFIMHIAAGVLLSTIAVLGHFVEGPEFPDTVNGDINNSWAEHELETTIDFSPSSRLINFLTGGLNTHIAHHLFPKICHTHYREITPIIEKYCLNNQKVYKKEKFLFAIASHFKYLQGLSKK